MRRHRRRRLLLSVVSDLVEGVRAMGELDFARLSREYGLPEPARQSIRRTSRGRAYLDVEWPQFRVVVEVDGVHHFDAPVIVADALRQNDVVLAESTVLRIPNLGLRVAPEQFMAQIKRALVAGGWQPN